MQYLVITFYIKQVVKQAIVHHFWTIHARKISKCTFGTPQDLKGGAPHAEAKFTTKTAENPYAAPSY